MRPPRRRSDSLSPEGRGSGRRGSQLPAKQRNRAPPVSPHARGDLRPAWQDRTTDRKRVRIVAIDASSDLMPAVYAVRHQVFVGEQAVPPALERDEFDDVAIHLAALRGDDVVGTLRIVVSGSSAKIGRMA